MELRLEPVGEAAFRPFGRVIEAPATGGEQALSALLGRAAAGTSVMAKLDGHHAATLPVTAPKMERHPLSEQIFLPVGPARYAIAAALDRDGEPDLSTLCGFLVEAPFGICYERGVWHLPIRILDAPATLLMMMHATGDPAIDTSWAELEEPITVVAG